VSAARTPASTATARKPARTVRATSRPARGSASPNKPVRKPSSTPRRVTTPARAVVERADEPRQVTVRAVMLFVVILVAFVLLAPTLRAYVAQQEQLRELNDAIAATQARTAGLQAAIDRWDDEAYVQAQARDRLGFVMPGETPYVVVDPETITGEEPVDTEDPGPVTMPRTGPWYLTVWDSVQVAGEVDD